MRRGTARRCSGTADPGCGAFRDNPTQFVLRSGQPFLVEAQMRHTFPVQPRHAYRVVPIALLSLESLPRRGVLHHVRRRSLATFIAGLPRSGRAESGPGCRRPIRASEAGVAPNSPESDEKGTQLARKRTGMERTILQGSAKIGEPARQRLARHAGNGGGYDGQVEFHY